jgi:hypothetical protein
MARFGVKERLDDMLPQAVLNGAGAFPDFREITGLRKVTVRTSRRADLGRCFWTPMRLFTISRERSRSLRA